MNTRVLGKFTPSVGLSGLGRVLNLGIILRTEFGAWLEQHGCCVEQIEVRRDVSVSPNSEIAVWHRDADGFVYQPTAVWSNVHPTEVRWRYNGLTMFLPVKQGEVVLLDHAEVEHRRPPCTLKGDTGRVFLRAWLFV